MRPLNVSNLIGCGGTISHPMWKCTEVCRSAQKCVEGTWKCTEMHREEHRNVQRCVEFVELHKSVWRVHSSAQRCCRGVHKGAEGCMEVQGEVHRGLCMYTEGCVEVCRGVYKSLQKYAHTCTEVPEGCTWVCFHWLLLVTIHLVGDNRKFEV